MSHTHTVYHTTSCVLTKLAEDVFEFAVVHVLAKVLNVDICKLFGSSSHLSLTLFTGFEASNKPVNATHTHKL